MEIKVIRTKEGVSIPSNPEDKSSVITFKQAGLLTLIPGDFKLSKEKYDLIQTIETKKKKD